MTPPEPFNGKPASQLREFLTQLRLVFAGQPSKFQNDRFKVIYAASLLRGTAFSWFQPYLDMTNPPAWLSDFALFTAEINKVFGDPELRISAARSLDRLRQTGSAIAYAAEFRRHATILNWEDEPLAHRFYQGLKDSVKDEIVRFGRPKELDTLVQLAINIDSRIYERVMERNHDIRPSTSAPRRNQLPHTTVRTQSVPHSLSADASRDSASTPVPSGSRPVEAGSARPRFRRLTEEEKAHRRRNNLCLYCGDPHHIALDCPVRPKTPFRPARASQATFAEARPSGNGPTQSQ
jgi:Retrotransposon gag protein